MKQNEQNALTKKILQYQGEIQELTVKRRVLIESTTPANKVTRKIEDELIKKRMQRVTEKMYDIKNKISYSEKSKKRKQEEKSKYIEQKKFEKDRKRKALELKTRSPMSNASYTISNDDDTLCSILTKIKKRKENHSPCKDEFNKLNLLAATSEHFLSPEMSILMSPLILSPVNSPSLKRNEFGESIIKKELCYNHITPFDKKEHITKYDLENKNKLVIGKLQKIKFLTAAEIRMVSSYGKDELFPTMKFVERSDPDLLFGGSIMNEIFAKLKIHINGIDDEDAYEIKYKIRDIFSVLTTHITSRRSYVRETLEKLIISKYKKKSQVLIYLKKIKLTIQMFILLELIFEKRMFDITILQKFRQPEYENDEEVKQAWFVYCYEIMRCVSLKWKKSLSKNYICSQAKLDSSITTSDEAFARWLLYLKLPNLLKLAEEGNLNKEEVKKKIKQGPHDSKTNIHLYSTIYGSVKETRSNATTMKKWNDIFWEQTEIFCKNQLRKRCADNSFEMKSIIETHRISLPSRDIINEDFY